MIRFFSRRVISIKCYFKRFLLLFIILFVSSFFVFSKYDGNFALFLNSNKAYPYLPVLCISHNINITPNYTLFDDNRCCFNQSRVNKTLVLFTKDKSPNHRIRVVLESLKVDYEDYLLNHFFGIEFNLTKVLSFSLLIIEDLPLFYKQKANKLAVVLEYCRLNKVEIIGLVSGEKIVSKIGDLPLHSVSNVRMTDIFLSNSGNFFNVTKRGTTLKGTFSGNSWSFLLPTDKQFEILAFSKSEDNFFENVYKYDTHDDRYYQAVMLRDLGRFDGIRKVIIGIDVNYWLGTLLFVDSLIDACHVTLDLSKVIQIDIDDIFVGKTGTRMLVSDVDSLIDYQHRWAHRFVDNFKFNLGFSGYYYQSGNQAEKIADEFLLQKRDVFTWFPHLWSHKKPHLLTREKLHTEMMNNFQFAQTNRLNVTLQYAIAPFHSGVYPAYDVLYQLWKDVWNVSVTATEEYPKLNPQRNRQGFVYRNISVLPRQTCGIYTHTMYLDKYPRGREVLDNSILGGTLFQAVLFNKVNIFMTHFTNYGSDRLGTYTFDALFRFMNCFTNIKFVQKTPAEFAKIYFEKYPMEKFPLWLNPCTYNRHKAMLPIIYSCNKLPKLVIVGPQKTGTTALHKFLTLHPDLSTSRVLNDTFEEVQFFSSVKYLNGLQWYMDLFSGDDAGIVNFEKSATYFDNINVPRLMHLLLPDSKIIIMLMNPILRAYSWYQHMIAHNDATALKYSFHQVVTTANSSDDNLIKLRHRCLDPGIYNEHLKRWMSFFSPANIILLDSDHIRRDPVSLMNGLQQLLPVKRKIDYSNILIYNAKKRFYCLKTSMKNPKKCLGSGKGRQYKKMANETYDYLHNYYLSHSKKLIKLLLRYQYTSFPKWLKDISDHV